MRLRESAASGVRWTTLSMVCVTLFEAVRLIVLGRLLPPNAFGLMAMMIVVIGFGQIFSEMGLVQAVIQRLEPKGDELVSLYWLNIFAGLFVYLLFLLANPLVAKIFSSPGLKLMLPYVGFMFVLNPLGDLYRAMLEKNLRFKSLAGIEMSGAFLGMLVSIAMAVMGFGVWSLIWGQLTTVVCRNLCYFSLGQKMFRLRLHFRKDDLQGYLRFGLQHVGAMSVNYINSRLDHLLVGVLLGPQALGFYSMACNLVIRPVQRINPILTRVAFPVLAKVQDDNKRMKRGYFKMLNMLTSVNAPILIGLAAVSSMAVPAILGDKWLPIVPVTQVLALYSLIRSTGNAGGSMVLAKGRADVEFYWNIFLFCFIPIIIFCATYFGNLLTVAWALFSLQATLFLLWYVLIVRRLLGPCFLGYISSVGIPVLMAAGMGTLLYLLNSLLLLEVSLPILLFQIITGAVTYLTLCTLFAREATKKRIRLIFNKA